MLHPFCVVYSTHLFVDVSTILSLVKTFVNIFLLITSTFFIDNFFFHIVFFDRKDGVFTMNERLKILRKSLKLTQQEFADRIGIKRNSLANYEIGRNTPIDAIVVSICREFNVNEDWLRTGNGEMFLTTNRNADIARLHKTTFK